MLGAICKAVSSERLWVSDSLKLSPFAIFNRVVLAEENPVGQRRGRGGFLCQGVDPAVCYFCN